MVAECLLTRQCSALRRYARTGGTWKSPLTGFTISDEDAKSNKRRAELWVERLMAILCMDLPFYKVGIAHPVCSLMSHKSREDYIETLNKYGSIPLPP